MKVEGCPAFLHPSGCVGWALASPSGCNPPANAVQVQLLPDTLRVVHETHPPLTTHQTGLVAQPAEHLSLKQGDVGSIPTGATAENWACRLTGRRSACTRQMRVRFPPRSTGVGQVVEWQTRQAQNLVPTGREGSTPSLVTDSFRGRLTVGRRTLNPSMLVRSWACRLTGRRSVCTRQMRVQLPPQSTENWPGGGTGRHAVVRRPCPPRREGSSPSLVTL